MYFGINHNGVPGLGFASFENQSADDSHTTEWAEILDEIIHRGVTPIMLRTCAQSEFFETAAAVPK